MTLKNQGNLAKKASKPTWFKAEVEPCVGTSLFFEVPIDVSVTESLMATKKTSGKNGLGTPVQHSDDKNNKSKSSLSTSKKPKKTLVLNPKKSQIILP